MDIKTALTVVGKWLDEADSSELDVESFHAGGGFILESQPDNLGDAEELTHYDCWPGRENSERGFEEDDAKREALERAFGAELASKWETKYGLAGLTEIGIRYKAGLIGQAQLMAAMDEAFAQAGWAVYDGGNFLEAWRLPKEVKEAASILHAAACREIKIGTDTASTRVRLEAGQIEASRTRSDGVVITFRKDVDFGTWAIPKPAVEEADLFAGGADAGSVQVTEAK